MRVEPKGSSNANYRSLSYQVVQADCCEDADLQRRLACVRGLIGC